MTTEQTIHETPAQDQSAQASPQPERDENGPFKKGNKGGLGNPFAQGAHRITEVEVITPE